MYFEINEVIKAIIYETSFHTQKNIVKLTIHNIFLYKSDMIDHLASRTPLTCS